MCQRGWWGGICHRGLSGSTVCGICHQSDSQVVSLGGVGLVTCVKGDCQVAYAKWHLSRVTDYPVACFNERDLLSSDPPFHDPARS